MRQNGIKLIPLEKAQKREVKKLWGKKGIFNYDTHKLVYWATGKFDVKIVPEVFVRAEMEYQLNNQIQKQAWADKNIFDGILSEENTPRTIVHCIDGVFYDRYYEYLTVEEAILNVNVYKRVFYKPAIYSGVGRGIKILENINVEELKGLGNNYIIQEMIEVHPDLKLLDATKVVVMRMITFYIEGQVYVTSSSVLVGIGKENKTPEVKEKGETCIVIGITDDGHLKEYGYYPSGKTSKKVFNGFEFGGMEIPGYQQAVILLKKMHKRLPHHRFVGWDVTINSAGRPVVVEYNIKSPGVLYYQYTNGSLFGKSFDKIYNSLK